MDKKALVAEVTPLPSGYTGSIKISNPKSLFVGDTAILSYDEDEKETIFGQAMTARYQRRTRGCGAMESGRSLLARCFGIMKTLRLGRLMSQSSTIMLGLMNSLRGIG
jgi:hypothetical protein